MRVKQSSHFKGCNCVILPESGQLTLNITQEIVEIHVLPNERLRVLHARAFASAIAQFCDDQELDDNELIKLRRLHQCLSKLGWAPGE
jgi:hypothetical protein